VADVAETEVDEDVECEPISNVFSWSRHASTTRLLKA